VAITERGSFEIFGLDIRWWFHNFNRATIKGYNTQDAKKAFDKLKRLPSGKGGQSIGKASLGSNQSANSLANKVASFSVRTELFTTLRTELFGVVEDDLYNELVLNSQHDILPSP